MGNVLKATSERLTSDQFREYINLLKGITYKLLLKRHIDVAVDMYQKIQTEDIDYLEGTTAGDILAKIRFKNTKDVLWNYVGTVPSSSEYNSDVVFSDEIMDSNPRFWTIGQLMAGMNELERFRIEFFGTEANTETQQTDEKRKAAMIQATLAVFKSVFAQLPAEQPAPQVAPGAEQSPNSPESLIQKLKSIRKKRHNKLPPDTSEFLEKIRSHYSRDLRGISMENIQDIYFELFGRKMITDDEPEADTSSKETSNNGNLAVSPPVVPKSPETNKTAAVQTDQSEISSNYKRTTEPRKTPEVSSSDITATELSKTSKISVKGKTASKMSKSEKTSTKLSSKKRKSSTEKKLQKENIKTSSNKNETSEPSVDKNCSEQSLALNPTLAKTINKGNSDSSIQNHDPKKGNNSTLNIPIQIENKPFVYSDSLSEAFSSNPVSILKRNDPLKIYEKDSLVDNYKTDALFKSDSEVSNHILNEPLYQNISDGEHELLSGNNDEPSEPDDPLPNS